MGMGSAVIGSGVHVLWFAEIGSGAHVTMVAMVDNASGICKAFMK